MKTALKNITIFFILVWSVQTSALAASTVSFRVSCVIAPAVEMTTPDSTAKESLSPSSDQDPAAIPMSTNSGKNFTETSEYRKTASGLVKIYSITAL